MTDGTVAASAAPGLLSLDYGAVCGWGPLLGPVVILVGRNHRGQPRRDGHVAGLEEIPRIE